MDGATGEEEGGQAMGQAAALNVETVKRGEMDGSRHLVSVSALYTCEARVSSLRAPLFSYHSEYKTRELF